MVSIDYSPFRDDLFRPCNRGNFFPTGFPADEVGLCAEMCRLAYCRVSLRPEALDFRLDQAKITNVISGLGFTECRFFDSSVRPDARGTHCFVALNAVKKLAVAAYRGTDADDPTDITDDINFPHVPWAAGGTVHRGFADAFSEVHPDLTVPAGGWRVLITGHSLGAALATLLASLNQSAALYSFGSPLVGDATFVAALAKVENHRYVDCCDIVTTVPPEAFGYQHLGRREYVDRKGAILHDPPELFVFEDRTSAKSEYALKYLFMRGTAPARDLADHSLINYMSAIMHIRGSG